MAVPSVTEIHRYPLRPEGYLEPLFPTNISRRAVAEHLLEAPWLHRASDLEERSTYPGEVAHVREEPVEVEAKGGWVRIIRSGRSRRCSWRRRKVVEILDRWRLVGDWWDEEKHTDRLLFRVLLSGNEVVDLARARSGEWFLVGVVD